MDVLENSSSGDSLANISFRLNTVDVYDTVSGIACIRHEQWRIASDHPVQIVVIAVHDKSESNL